MTTLSTLLGKLTTVLSLLSVAFAQTAVYPVLPSNAANLTQISQGTMLYRVAACESTGNPNGTPRQFNSDGSILWGNDPNIKGATTTDVGMFQISLKYHGNEVRQLGLDVVHSEQDNITYALLLYRRFGLQPWSASRHCWEQ